MYKMKLDDADTIFEQAFLEAKKTRSWFDYRRAPDNNRIEYSLFYNEQLLCQHILRDTDGSLVIDSTNETSDPALLGELKDIVMMVTIGLISNAQDENWKSDTVPEEFRAELREKLRACVDWVGRPTITDKTLQDFLDMRFGTTNGYPNMPSNKFYSRILPEAQNLGLVAYEDGKYKPIFLRIRDAYAFIDKLVGYTAHPENSH